MFEIKIKITCSIGSGWTSSNTNNRSPKLLAERWARLWDYFSRTLFGLGSVQEPDRGWLKVGTRLRTRLGGLAWPGSGSVSHSALFGAGLARSLAQLGSVLTSVHYSLLVSKLNVISPDQLDSTFGSAQLGDRFDSVRFSCLALFCSKLSSS